MNEMSNLSEFMKRVFPNMGDSPVVAGPGGPYPMPKIETNESFNQRLTKLEVVVKSLSPAFVELGQHLGQIETNFKLVQVACNDLHAWAYSFLDEYNERNHPASPIAYPPSLPQGFAIQSKAVDSQNVRFQEVINENAVLRKEYDEMHKKYNAILLVPPKYEATAAGRAKELQEDLNESIRERNTAEDKVAELEEELAALKKRKATAKKLVKKKAATK